MGIYQFWRCFKVLPAVYDESLSYYQVLCKLTSTIDSVLEQIEKDNQDIYKYIDQQDKYYFEQSKAYTDASETKLIEMINNNLIILNKLILSTDQANRVWTMTQINELQAWLMDRGDSLMVTNPLTGLLDSIQNVLNSFVNHFMYLGLTCSCYDSLELTCNEYDIHELTCFQYDYYGMWYLAKDTRFYMSHPATGETVFYKDVIYWLASLHMTDTLTCSEYDAKELTVSAYDAKQLTAYQYDWQSKSLIA